MSTGERVCWTIVVLGVAMTAAPFVAEETLAPMGDARFALAFVGAIAGLSAFVTSFFLRSRNRVKRHLLAGRDLLARWTYAETEWRAFAGEETKRQAGSKRVLLWITAGFMLLATIGFMARDQKAGLFVGAVLFVTWVLCWLVARASVRAQARHETGPMPEVRINRDGLLIGDELHIWRGWGNLLHSCTVVEGPPRLVEITYSMQGRRARQFETVRVPIPVGKEAEAAELVQRLQD